MNDGDFWGYYMAYRGYKYAYKVFLSLQVLYVLFGGKDYYFGSIGYSTQMPKPQNLNPW